MSANNLRLKDVLDADQIEDLRRFAETSGDEPAMWGGWSEKLQFLVGAIAQNGGLLHIEAHHCPSRELARRELAKIGGNLPSKPH